MRGPILTSGTSGLIVINLPNGKTFIPSYVSSACVILPSMKARVSTHTSVKLVGFSGSP